MELHGEKTPSDVQAYEKGIALLKENRLDEALVCFQEAATTGMDRPMEHYALGVTCFKRRDYGPAREALTRFLEMTPEENKYTRQARAVLPKLEQAETEEEPQPEKPNLARDPDYAEGLEAYMRGDYEGANAAFAKTLESFPNNPHVQNNQALTLLELERHEEAVALLEEVLQRHPDFVEARNNQGLAWTAYGTYRARLAFEAALEEDPHYFDALVNLANLYYREGKMPQARRLWQRALRLRPGDKKVQKCLEMFD